jgi:hypothetical protein
MPTAGRGEDLRSSLAFDATPICASLEMNERPIACFVMRAKCRLASGGHRRRAAGRASAGLFSCDFLEQLQDFIQIQIASENPHET